MMRLLIFMVVDDIGMSRKEALEDLITAYPSKEKDIKITFPLESLLSV